MEEALVAFFLQRLNSLLLQEIEVFSGLEDQILLLIAKLSDLKSQIQLLKSRLNGISYFANDATSIGTEENKKFIQNWLGRLRESIHNADDCIDQFILKMNSRDGSDQNVAVAVFRSELGMINECVAEILDYKSQLDVSIASIEISKDKLIKLLVAEGLIQEISGEIMENIAEENINKLIDLRMLKVSNEDEKAEWNFCTVPNSYLHCVEGDENLFISNTNSDANIPLNIRRVCIHNIDDEILHNLTNLHIPIRSLFVSYNHFTNNSHLNLWETLLYRLKFLRVLNIEGIKFKRLPEDVGSLIHLRYLGLRGSDLYKLPKGLGCLRNLQTLDIRWSKIKKLPSGILNLLQLRHLQMDNNTGILVPKGMGRLPSLQTLTGLYVQSCIANELSNLTQLRTLGIIGMSEENASDVSASIMKMTGLFSLSLMPERGHCLEEELLPSLESFSPPPLLRDLHLKGCLEEMPNWLSSMENLTDLSLSHSYLFENSTSIIQFLPNLKRLCLWNAFEAKHIGREFCRPGGFPSLEVLTIYSKSLVEWTELEEGVLQSLKVLRFNYCSNLRILPEGLQLITTLQKLEFFPLHGDLARRLSPNGGKENYKIKHIAVLKPKII